MKTPKIEMDRTCNAAPVQYEGTVDGTPFYFRARHEHWSFSAGVDPVKISLGWAEGFNREEEWGETGHHDASYMPYEEAEKIIKRCCEEFVNEVKP